MRTIVLIFLFGACPILHLFGQKNTKEADSIRIKKLENAVKELEKRIDNKLDEKDSIGFMSLIGDSVNVYDSTNNKCDRQKIIYADLMIGEGCLIKIRIKLRNGEIFGNSQNFIEISEIYNSRCDHLHSKNKSKYIILCDAISYDGKNVLPENQEILLTEKSEKINLWKNHGLNNVFQARAYTDLLGLINEESNGLAQAEMSYFNIIHAKNKFRKPIYFFHDLGFTASVSKFDDTIRVLKKSDSITNHDLFQNSFFSFKANMNFVKYYFNKTLNHISINLIGGINYVRYQEADSLAKQLINMPYLGGNVVLKTHPWDSFGFDLGYSYQRVWFYGLSKTPTIGNSEDSFTVFAEVYWNPNKDLGKRIFGRVRYFDFIGKSNPFTQVQLGYSVNFSDWLKSKK